MITLKEEELKEINGGFNLSGAVLTAALKIGQFLFEIGRKVGSSFRRIQDDNMCSLY